LFADGSEVDGSTVDGSTPQSPIENAGSVVGTQHYPGQDHGGAVIASLVDSVPFVKKLFAGQPVAGNCATLRTPPISN